MSDVFSDGRSTPSPTIAQLLLLSQSELLELTVPADKRKPIEPWHPPSDIEQKLKRSTTCEHCGEKFNVYIRKVSSPIRKTCSRPCLLARLTLCHPMRPRDHVVYTGLLELARADNLGWE